jgi:hypothetical protein
MSYDIRFGVKVEGMGGYIATIDEPEHSSPTYNLRNMFVACMDWDYEQGKWYNCAEVIPKFLRGVGELRSHPKKYEKYNAPNGWGTVGPALETLESVVKKAKEITEGRWTWNEIPLEHLWMRW